MDVSQKVYSDEEKELIPRSWLPATHWLKAISPTLALHRVTVGRTIAREFSVSLGSGGKVVIETPLEISEVGLVANIGEMKRDGWKRYAGNVMFNSVTKEIG